MDLKIFITSQKEIYIKNIIKIKNQYNEQFCLVRAKTLRDIIDAENQFNNFKDIII